ncbi:unnamed protein product [Rotaria sordida]|uniref:Uncharacterized protein n=1 Tax=Rotaria sordida TaxID=392033 RepID=A0A819YCW4_9BILA|nr:unnamed protein product [Rotaria sordida]CAF4154189.1 unnamed protein product [Rotaria sordida]
MEFSGNLKHLSIIGSFRCVFSRRQEYKFHWEFENQICPNIQETRLNSVKHLLICGKQVANNSVNYFPNVTQFTIEHYFKTSDDLILLKLNLLKLDSSPLDEILIISIETSKTFENVLNINTIKNLDIRIECSFKKFK